MQNKTWSIYINKTILFLKQLISLENYLKAVWGQSVIAFVFNFEKVALKFNLSPFGGSVTTLKDLCNIAMGKLSIGSVVNHNLFLGCDIWWTKFKKSKIKFSMKY